MTRNKQKKGQKQQQNPQVTEAARIRISEILQEFRASDKEVYTFEANLSNYERAAVHQYCQKMGMKSKSYGGGSQRRVSVYKSSGKVDEVKGKETLTHLKFCEETKEVLLDLFTHYPPEIEEAGGEVDGKHDKKAEKTRRRKDDIFCKPSMNKEEIVKKVESLNSKLEKTANLRQITADRSKLPIATFKDIITSTVESHQVVLISGETGCGKTTQVPQFILEHMWRKGEACKIVCTQPRRISAISVAERIAHERGENVGNDVGYKIRLESKGGRDSSIVFCTNGVLLRVLVSKGGAMSKTKIPNKRRNKDDSDITHIIVDEIHERDRHSDFTLAILREMLPSYPHLRLILMSATLDSERFSQYFGGCPIIRVPGFTYPVKTFYLDDVLCILRSKKDNHLDSAISSASNEISELTEEDKVALDEAINLAWSSDEFDMLLDLVSTEGTTKIINYQHSVTGLTPLMVFAQKGRVGDVCMLISFGANCQLQASDGTTALELAERENQQEVAEIFKKQLENTHSDSVGEQQLLSKYLSTINPELIDVVLIVQLLRKICTDSEDGAILIFLPGWDYINKTRDKLLATPFFKDASKFVIISLHSMIPSAEQKKVFKRPPPGCRKIVLSTNIAETAVTIDDVVYVIDSGRMKEKSYDPYDNVSTLQSSWISKASAKQREGRAGRCQAGICYHLYSKLRASSLPDFQVPEIKRMPIEELCLQVKLLDPNGKIEDFLQKTLDPPVSETIHNAIRILEDIGALSTGEELTNLGQKLGSLPVHPLTSKMIFFAIMMNCLDPALTLACASDYRDPFTIPMLLNEKKKADAAKEELAAIYGGQSDQLTVVAAFDCWKKAKERGQEQQFCSRYFVSAGTMHMLNGMRKQLQSELVRTGLISEDVSNCSLNAHDPGIVHAVLAASLYPMVGRLRPPHKSGKRFVETANGDKVRVHPHSANFKLSCQKSDHCPLILYDEITRGDGGMHIRKCTVVGPLPLLLLATEMVVIPGDDDNEDDDGNEDNGSDADANEENLDEDDMEIDVKSDTQPVDKVMSSPGNSVTVIVDRWLSFGSTALDVAQVYCLRERLSAAILFKVKHPQSVLPPVLGASMYAIACVLSYDGLSGIKMLFKSSQTEGTNDFLRSLLSHPSDNYAHDFHALEGTNWNGFDLHPSSHDYMYDGPDQSILQGPSNVPNQIVRPSYDLHQRPPSQGPNNYPSQNTHPTSPSSLKNQNFPSRGRNSGRSRNAHPPSASASNQHQRHKLQGPKNNPNQGFGRQSTSASSNLQQRPPQQGHKDSSQAVPPPSSTPPNLGQKTPKHINLAGYGSGRYGPYGPRGDSFKKNRGNGSG